MPAGEDLGEEGAVGVAVDVDLAEPELDGSPRRGRRPTALSSSRRRGRRACGRTCRRRSGTPSAGPAATGSGSAPTARCRAGRRAAGCAGRAAVRTSRRTTSRCRSCCSPVRPRAARACRSRGPRRAGTNAKPTRTLPGGRVAGLPRPQDRAADRPRVDDRAGRRADRQGLGPRERVRPRPWVRRRCGREPDQEQERRQPARARPASQLQAARAVRRPDHRDEVADRVLVRGERAGPEVRALEAALHRLARRPVLAVGDVPELHAPHRRDAGSRAASATSTRPRSGPGSAAPSGASSRSRDARRSSRFGQQVDVLHRVASARPGAASRPARRSATSSPSRRAGPSPRRPSCPGRS